MKALAEISNFQISEVGEEVCPKCGSSFKLYQTPRGVLGACKTCADRELIQSLNLPTVEDLQKMKLSKFVEQLEKVTSDIKNASVKGYKPTHESQIKAKQVVIKYINEFDGKKSIVFSGNPGVGKSHLAYAATKAIRSKGYTALFIKSTYLLERIKASYSLNSNVSEEQIFDMLELLDLLVIDDIGSEYVKQNDGYETWASEVLYKILDMRIEKANIYSTNYTESELTDKYGTNGPRIISRMLNKSIAHRIEGKDYRRQEVF